MPIGLHNLEKSRGVSKSKRRVGRGLGSGSGAKSGRGQKGQKSRSGASGFQRLGMRKLMLATPKLRGFKSGRAKKAVVSLESLEQAFAKNEMVTPKVLVKKGLIDSTSNGVKILGDGEITSALKIQGCAVSKSAAEKILAAGGEIIA